MYFDRNISEKKDGKKMRAIIGLVLKTVNQLKKGNERANLVYKLLAQSNSCSMTHLYTPPRPGFRINLDLRLNTIRAPL